MMSNVIVFALKYMMITSAIEVSQRHRLIVTSIENWINMIECM